MQNPQLRWVRRSQPAEHPPDFRVTDVFGRPTQVLEMVTVLQMKIGAKWGDVPVVDEEVSHE